jgi:hypothetical protein
MSTFKLYTNQYMVERLVVLIKTSSPSVDVSVSLSGHCAFARVKFARTHACSTEGTVMDASTYLLNKAEALGSVIVFFWIKQWRKVGVVQDVLW